MVSAMINLDLTRWDGSRGCKEKVGTDWERGREAFLCCLCPKFDSWHPRPSVTSSTSIVRKEVRTKSAVLFNEALYKFPSSMDDYSLGRQLVTDVLFSVFYDFHRPLGLCCSCCACGTLRKHPTKLSKRVAAPGAGFCKAQILLQNLIFDF